MVNEISLICCNFFARGLYNRTAVACLPLHQLAFLVIVMNHRCLTTEGCSIIRLIKHGFTSAPTQHWSYGPFQLGTAFILHDNTRQVDDLYGWTI